MLVLSCVPKVTRRRTCPNCPPAGMQPPAPSRWPCLDSCLWLLAPKPFRHRWVAVGDRGRREKLRKWAEVEQKNDVQTSFPDNAVHTARYRWWNFVPLNLFHQFRRLVNFYFLVTLIITFALKKKSPVDPLTWFYALVAVILMSMIKQGYEDYMRYRKDV